MGKKLNNLKKLNKIIEILQTQIKQLSKIAKDMGNKNVPDTGLMIYVYYYASLNYRLSLYLIEKFPEYVNSDKIERDFNDIIKHWNNGN